VTRELLSIGDRIVPFLVARLPESSLDDAIYIVFLLGQMDATEARPALLELQSQLDDRSAGRDLTLRMQVEYFLRDT